MLGGTPRTGAPPPPFGSNMCATRAPRHRPLGQPSAALTARRARAPLPQRPCRTVSGRAQLQQGLRVDLLLLPPRHLLVERLDDVGDEEAVANLLDAHLLEVLLGQVEQHVALDPVLDEQLNVLLEPHSLEHLAHVLDAPRRRLQREADLPKRRHRVRRELHADLARPRDDVVVQLGEQLDKVEPVADDAEAEVAQVFLGQQEDGAAVDVVVEEGGGEVPQPERL
mmetsp:Transcript_48618/g.156506  ORF Transcript_48618/g.156506 Transcript_48618/m.156506 type:complete len:225 (-) Transcript_48618:704-1378(-)